MLSTVEGFFSLSHFLGCVPTREGVIRSRANDGKKEGKKEMFDEREKNGEWI